jgi:hypothetical protein
MATIRVLNYILTVKIAKYISQSLLLQYRSKFRFILSLKRRWRRHCGADLEFCIFDLFHARKFAFTHQAHRLHAQLHVACLSADTLFSTQVRIWLKLDFEVNAA